MARGKIDPGNDRRKRRAPRRLPASWPGRSPCGATPSRSDRYGQWQHFSYAWDAERLVEHAAGVGIERAAVRGRAQEALEAVVEPSDQGRDIAEAGRERHGQVVPAGHHLAHVVVRAQKGSRAPYEQHGIPRYRVCSPTGGAQSCGPNPRRVRAVPGGGGRRS